MRVHRPLLFACKQKYEEKRRRYLASKRERPSDEPRVRFEEGQIHGTFLTARPENESMPQSHLPPGQEPRRFSTETNRLLDSTGVKFSPQAGGKGDRDGEQQWESEANHQASTAESLGDSRGRPPSPKQDNQYSSRAETDRKAEYARQLREQIAANAAAAQRARNNQRHPATAPFAGGLAPRPYADEIEGGDRRGINDDLSATGEGSNVRMAIDRKAEYARQLREQMAADEAARRAKDHERRRPTDTTTVRRPTDNHGTREQVNTKAEYARQLREQMAMNEYVRRADGKRNHSPSAGPGPAWLESAAEGTERQRTSSKLEYAEQLRAQIAEKKSIQHSHARDARAPPDISGQMRNENRNQRRQLHRQGHDREGSYVEREFGNPEDGNRVHPQYERKGSTLRHGEEGKGRGQPPMPTGGQAFDDHSMAR